MKADGWKNTYESHPKRKGRYLVEDHNGNRFISEFEINQFGTPCWSGGKGYDICWWKDTTS